MIEGLRKLVDRIDYYKARAEKAEALLLELFEHPYVLDDATIPRGGIEKAPQQVVGTLRVGLLRYWKLRELSCEIKPPVIEEP